MIDRKWCNTIGCVNEILLFRLNCPPLLSQLAGFFYANLTSMTKVEKLNIDKFLNMRILK